jgi:acyl-CoA thioester hydrolase
MVVGRSRITLEQAVMRGEEVLAKGEVHLVCVGAESFKPVSVPAVLSRHWKI